MDQHLFIVARDSPGLREYLAREFSTEQNVEVILDRRAGPDRRSGHDRRGAPRGPVAPDRRATDRRALRAVDDQIRSLGYAMLRLG